MSLLTVNDEVQIAQEVAIATLRGLLRARGAKADFARRAGMSAVHLSYILHEKRMPKMPMAKRMAAAMPLSADERRNWLNHVEQYWQRSESLAAAVRLYARDDIDAAVREVTHLHHQAMYDADPACARQGRELALRLGRELLAVASPEMQPIAWLTLSEWVYEMYSLLAHHVEALAQAKRAWLAASVMRPHPRDVEAFEGMRVNAGRLIIITLNNLGLARLAFRQAGELFEDRALQRAARYVHAPLTWDCLNAMADLPRSSLRDARKLREDADITLMQKESDDFDILAYALLGRSYAEVCITHGRYREAAANLPRDDAALAAIPHLGLPHRVMFLRTRARLLWKQPQCDLDEWRSVMRQAVGIARSAALYNELAEFERQYGADILVAF